jgi:hypothetical protein
MISSSFAGSGHCFGDALEAQLGALDARDVQLDEVFGHLRSR